MKIVRVTLSPRLRALDEPFGGSSTRQRYLLLSGPAVPGQLGAAFVAATVEHVPVAREQLAGAMRSSACRSQAKASQAVRPWREYQSPAFVGSVHQYTGVTDVGNSGVDCGD